nr:MAG TPA: hypothetical protein [Caudoviricetes sp.]
MRSYIVKRFIRSTRRSQPSLSNYKGHIFDRSRAQGNSLKSNV